MNDPMEPSLATCIDRIEYEAQRNNFSKLTIATKDGVDMMGEDDRKRVGDDDYYPIKDTSCSDRQAAVVTKSETLVVSNAKHTWIDQDLYGDDDDEDGYGDDEEEADEADSSGGGCLRTTAPSTLLPRPTSTTLPLGGGKNRFHHHPAQKKGNSLGAYLTKKNEDDDDEDDVYTSDSSDSYANDSVNVRLASFRSNSNRSSANAQQQQQSPGGGCLKTSSSTLLPLPKTTTLPLEKVENRHRQPPKKANSFGAYEIKNDDEQEDVYTSDSSDSYANDSVYVRRESLRSASNRSNSVNSIHSQQQQQEQFKTSSSTLLPLPKSTTLPLEKVENRYQPPKKGNSFGAYEIKNDDDDDVYTSDSSDTYANDSVYVRRESLRSARDRSNSVNSIHSQQQPKPQPEKKQHEPSARRKVSLQRYNADSDSSDSYANDSVFVRRESLRSASNRTSSKEDVLQQKTKQNQYLNNNGRQKQENDDDNDSVSSDDFAKDSVKVRMNSYNSDSNNNRMHPMKGKQSERCVSGLKLLHVDTRKQQLLPNQLYSSTISIPSVHTGGDKDASQQQQFDDFDDITQSSCFVSHRGDSAGCGGAGCGGSEEEDFNDDVDFIFTQPSVAATAVTTKNSPPTNSSLSEAA